ncbi:hypothetical protein N657DRAFT_632047 [Parathielavia appendiculata]|uniref:Mediator of RNA polymerase II transcription subunit 4 n=1 Tax=Parathielavia appendiculata TaxID=2587402 RepID=A0AAN6U3M2_9PEZI|nr:hypothetical protein N657DRAFT_632047 [Parathielavia appendiculata]
MSLSHSELCYPKLSSNHMHVHYLVQEQERSKTYAFNMDKDLCTPMGELLDCRFERLEKALNVMIDSLAKNTPSEKLAEELVSAQEDLNDGLKLLERHQNNYGRIQQLRQETSLLDTQIKDIASSLWNMRKELKAVPTTAHPMNGQRYRFTTAELLAYGRRISRNTLPPPGVTNGVDMSTPEPSQTTQTPFTSFNTSFNGTVGTPGPMSATPNTTLDTQTTSQQLAAAKPNTTEAKLPQHLKPAVNPLHNAAFQPWPTEAQIRSGGLAAIQRLVDAGIDPRGYDPEEEERKKQAEEQAKKEAEERARQEREAAERRMREERERMARERERARQQMEGGAGADRRDSVVGAGPRASKPKQFTFLGADDDDDEDED